MVAYENKGAMAATVVVAASDSLNKAAANYVCDGVADEVQINAALAALPAQGGRVVLLEGNYIGGGISILKSNVTLEGQGKSTRYTLANNSDDHIITIGDGTNTYTRIAILSIYFDGNSAGQGVGDWHGIYFKNNTGEDSLFSLVKDVEIYDIDGNGIRSEAWGVDIVSCIINEAGAEGILLANPNCRVIKCEILNTNGFKYYNTINRDGFLEISDNLIENSGENCIYMTYPPCGFNITSNELINSAAVYGCIDIHYAIGGRIIGNFCKTHYTGIQLKNTSHNILIENNQLFNCLEISIGITSGCYKVNIVGNSIVDGGYADQDGRAGISITNGYECTVIGNRIDTILGTHSRGIISAGTYNTISSNVIRKTSQQGIYIIGSYHSVVGNIILDNSELSNNYGQAIHIASSYNVVTANIINQVAANKAKYGIQESAGDYNVIESNNILGAVTSSIITVGANTIVRDNKGWITENSGTATVLNTTTSIAVAHGLAATPTRIQITPRENPTNAVSFWWVDTVGAANFTINVDADPGASNLDFDWHAQVGEG